ncbi:MAG: hypothetical protein GY753_07680 [Gammaproteobacteria bacterium]|nr:hypothetical protein [Gammaproteobacteria bacterium]
MATEVVKTIRSSGGDYTSLSAWESGEQTDLVSADEIAVAECYDDWPSGLNNSVDISGWTTDATRRIIIRTPASERHDGTPQSGFHVKPSLGYGRAVWLRTPYVTLEGIEVENTGAGGEAIGVFYSAGIIIDSCIIKAVDQGIKRVADTTIVRNTLIYDCDEAITISESSRSYTCENVTIANCTQGFHGDGDQVLKNCVAYGCTTNFDGTFSASSTNNASSDYSGDAPPGSNPYTSDVVSGDFEDAANDDYHLASGSGLIDQGADLSGSFTTDVDGDTRSGTWDIGFDEYAGSSGVTGTGTLLDSAPTLSGAGSIGHTGSGALADTVPTVNGVGSSAGSVTGTANLTDTVPTISGIGGLTHKGIGINADSTPVLTGAGILSHTGIGNLTDTLPVVTGVGYGGEPLEVWGGGGKSKRKKSQPKRKKRHFAEIDGELIEVDSPAEAIALFEAEQQAEAPDKPVEIPKPRRVVVKPTQKGEKAKEEVTVHRLPTVPSRRITKHMVDAAQSLEAYQAVRLDAYRDAEARRIQAEEEEVVYLLLMMVAA